MKKITVAGFVLILLAACSKDKFQTKPQITVNSYSTKTVSQQGGDLVMNLKFTDSEGDLGTGQFVYIIKRTNRRPLLPGNAYPDSVKSVLPEFPDNSQGEFELRLQWNNLHRDDRENDSIFFRFVVVDRAGNKSDTLNSDPVVILRQ